MAKFSKVVDCFSGIGKNPVKKFDCEIAYKKIVNNCEEFDIYAFIRAIRFLLRSCFGRDSSITETE